MIKPDPLQTGDTIAIIAPARQVKEEDLTYAVDVFKSWGLKVILSKNIFSKKHSYLAGTDQERLEDFQTMIDNPSIKAIVCARGGYGSTRVVDALNLSTLRKNPKWISGFSDITAVHLHLCRHGFQSIHAAMPILFAKPDAGTSIESLRKVLFGIDEPLVAAAETMNKKGNATGETLGGNLSLIVDSLGTGSEPDFNNKILIIEEIDEYLYKIDRMVMQLKRAKKLSVLAGLAVGHFTEIKEGTLPFGETVGEIILRATKEYSYPVAFGFTTGHENPNLAWRHGAKVSFVVGDFGSRINFLDGENIIS